LVRVLAQTLYLSLAMKCILSKQLERRLNGLGYLQHLMMLARNAKLSPLGLWSFVLPGDTDKSYVRVDTTSWLTTDAIVALVQVRVLLRGAPLAVLSWRSRVLTSVADVGVGVVLLRRRSKSSRTSLWCGRTSS
jgi:hypothetical protein